MRAAGVPGAVGKPRRFDATLRGAALVAAAAMVLPLVGWTPSAHVDAPAPPAPPRRTSDADAAAIGERWTDSEWGLALTPPVGWVLAPTTSLNPASVPPDPVLEVARFQLAMRDATLYAQPVALTAGLIDDAGAVLSIGIARERSALVGAKPDRLDHSARTMDFVAIDDELTFDGLRTMTRVFYARRTDRVVVARLVADEDVWSAVAPGLLRVLRTLSVDPQRPNAPAAPVAPPPPSTPAVAPAEIVDPSLAIRGEILRRARSLLGIPYVWGGNSPTRGMDCSAWLSRVWGVDRYTTESIWQVSFAITKEDLRPGDALNLTTGRDPRRLGHIRLFEAWANAAHTVMWVYEETPPRSVHRVIAYDGRYQPIRLFGLTSAGVALVVPGTPAPERTSPPRATRPPARATPRPTARVTARPTLRPTATPRRSSALAPTVRPSSTPTPR